jgi:uncharacterized membrane protein AbrB (regulator of aidB expression)
LAALDVARLWVAPGALPRAAIGWFPAVAAGPFWETVALAVFGSIVGAKSRLPAGALAVLLHRVFGTDPLTAYLATTPGGADSVAIIAAAGPAGAPCRFPVSISAAWPTNA